WATNKKSDGRVIYWRIATSSTSTPTLLTVYNAGLVKSHTVSLFNLTASSKYGYYVVSVGKRGRTATSSTRYLETGSTGVTPPPPNDFLGPRITSLSIAPIATVSGGTITFSATAEDQNGVGNVVYDIRYPDGPVIGFYLRPNCNFGGVTSGTCTFSQSI